MAWTTIPDANLQPGKPARSIDALALRDNPVAIANGDAGAPPITDAAIDITATSTGKDRVNERIALSGVGEIGTYAMLRPTVIAAYAPGATLAGASLEYADAFDGATGAGSGGSPSGTWRLMGSHTVYGTAPDEYLAASMWLRIS